MDDRNIPVFMTREEFDAAKDNPDPGPGIAHDFRCTHDPCVCVSGDEHPSGLRDAIAMGRRDFRRNYFQLVDQPRSEAECIERSVVAWLSVVSEGEIDAAEAALRASSSVCGNYPPGSFVNSIRAALAASRGVLLPKEEK